MRILLKLPPTYLLKLPDVVIKMLGSVLCTWQLPMNSIGMCSVSLVELITVFSDEEPAKIAVV
jgi:hypothetical protein